MRSFSGSAIVAPPKLPRGMIVTLWIGSASLQQVLHDGVAGLVVGGRDLFLLVDHAALAGPAPADLVARLFEVVLLDVLLARQRRAAAPTR